MKTLLFNPFKKYREKQLLTIGILLTLSGSFLAFQFKGRFDGVLNLHFVSNISFWQPLLDNLINVLCLTIFLFIVAKYINKKTRIIDLLATATIARAPYYILPFFNINGYMKNTADELMKSVTPNAIPDIPIATIVVLLVFSFFTILFLVWYMILLFNGYRVSSNAKGVLPVVLFIVAVIVAEIVSKFLIYKLT